MLVLVLSAAPDTVTVGGISFARYSLQAGASESSLVVVDADGDGLQDLLVASSEDETLVTYLGTDSGEFVAGRTINAGADPTHIAVGDLNQDAWPDVVVANHETSYLTLLLGNGRGGFSPAARPRIEVDVDPHPHFVGLVDLTGDGLDDIAVDHRGGEGLLVLAGRGGGRFDPGVLVPAGGDPYLGFAIGDINGDGRLDVATPNPRDVGIVMGEDTGFGAHRRHATGFAPSAVALCDMDGDRHLDLIVASGESSRGISVWPGDGTGAFTKPIAFQAGRGLKTLATGDMNGDDRCDVAVGSWNGHLSVIVGGTELTQVLISDSGNPWGLEMADINGDGVDDLLVGDGSATRVDIYRSRVQR